MRILLVSPTHPDTFWSFRHALRLVRKRAVLPPLGLMTVASLLPQAWDLRLLDMNIQRLRPRDLQWADLVFIGGMTVQRSSARSVIEQCKAMGKRVVAGGPLVTCEPEAFADVDHLVLDEAELTLPPFLADLAEGRPRPVYRAEGKPDVRKTPPPRWDLVEMNRYAMMGVQFSRGCPFDCDFCNVTALFGRHPRTKAVGQMVQELDSLYAAGWRGPIFFVDDNFIGNRKATGELLDALAVWQRGKSRMPLNTEASINLADDPILVQRMVRAGFTTVFIGIETPDAAGLGECGKRQNLKRDMHADIRKLHAAGLQVQGGFIVGFDADTPSIFQRQCDFIQRSGICTAMLGLLQAPPGTKLFQRLRVEGRLLGSTTGDNVDGTTNIDTRLPLEFLRDGYRRAMQSLYAPKIYYERIRTFLGDYRPPRWPSRLSLRRKLSSLLALGRISFHLGLVDRGRLHYWKLLLGTLLKRPRQLELALTLWAQGHHFRKVAQRLG